MLRIRACAAKKCDTADDFLLRYMQPKVGILHGGSEIFFVNLEIRKAGREYSFAQGRGGAGNACLSGKVGRREGSAVIRLS